MKIVLGANNDQNQVFCKQINAVLATDMCSIKYIKQEVEIYIPFSKILDNGLIENTNLIIDEVLITLNVKEVFLGYYLDAKMLKELAFYQVKITQP